MIAPTDLPILTCEKALTYPLSDLRDNWESMLDMFLDFINSELQDRQLNCLHCNNHAAFSVF